MMTKEDIKRILYYWIVFFCCLFVGGFIAIDYLSATGNNFEKIISVKSFGYLLLIAGSYFIFLAQYVLRYKQKRCKLIDCIALVYMIFGIFIFFILEEQIKNITSIILVISFIGTWFYGRLSDTSLYIVRFELIWPSVFTVAIPIYTGYVVMSYGILKNWNKGSEIYYLLFGLYSLLIFLSMVSDKEEYKFKFFQEINNKKKKIKSIWPIHFLVLVGLMWLIFIDMEGAIITFLCICICAVMTIFETWDVISRKSEEKKRAYEKSLGFVTCLFLLLSTAILTIADGISIWYELVIIVTILFVGLVTFFIMQSNYFAKDDSEESKKKAARNIDKSKVVAYIVMSSLLIMPGWLKVVSIPRMTNNLKFIHFKKIAEWNLDSINIGSIIPTVVSCVTIIVPIVMEFCVKRNNLCNNDKKKKDRFLYVIAAFFAPKWILTVYTICCFLGICLCNFYKSNLIITEICAGKINVLKLFFMIASVIYMILQLIAIWKDDDESKNKENMSASEKQKSAREDGKIEPMKSYVVIKLLQMLHIPSCILLALLIIIPGLRYNNSFGKVVLIAAPFVLAAMGSFALNDYYDYEKDKINKPDRILPLGLIKCDTAKKIGLSILFVSFLIAIPASDDGIELIMYWSTTLLATLYSRFIKQISPIKAFYTAAVLVVPFAFSLIKWGNIEKIGIYVLGIFLYVAGKEILMDIFDLEGDKANGMKTLPIMFGKNKALIIAICCHIGSFVCFLSVYAKHSGYLFIYSLIFLIVCYIFWLKNKRNVQRIIVYCLWIPLICYTIQGWMV